MTPIELDGGHGEGGGQILRTALALAVARRRSVHLVRIRGERRRPGLQPQTSVPYLTDVFLPALEITGVRARVALRRPGWYPAGQGEIDAVVEPALPERGLTLDTPAPSSTAIGVSVVSRLPASVCVRGRAGFTALGRRGLRAEAMADAAVDAFLAWRASGAGADALLPWRRRHRGSRRPRSRLTSPPSPGWSRNSCRPASSFARGRRP